MNVSIVGHDEQLLLVYGPRAESSQSVDNILLDEEFANITLGEDFDSYRVPVAVEVLMYAMYITAAVAAVGGNGIVCYLVLAYQRMRTVTNFFIVNLAIGDILMAALCIPFGFVSNLLLQHWPFGSIMCVVVSYSQAVSVFISAYTLIAISIDRYIAILYPLRPRMSKLQAKVIIGSVWLVAILTPMPTALLSKLDQPPAWLAANVTDKYICTEEWTNFTHRYYYSMALMVLQYFFPLAVLVFTYTRIAIVVWGKRTPGEAEDSRDRRMAASKRKMVKMMITCVTAFTLCWLPFNTLVVAGDQYPEIFLLPNINYVWFACHWLAMSHAAYNPLIYIWMNSRFRAGFKYIFSFLPGITMSQLPDFLPHCSNVTLHSQATMLRGAPATNNQRRLNVICTKNYGTATNRASKADAKQSFNTSNDVDNNASLDESPSGSLSHVPQVAPLPGSSPSSQA